MKPHVGLIGGGDADEDALGTAEEVGRRVAESGAPLVCGGLGGVMEAGSRGASEAGGTVIGILPGTSKEDANQYVDVCVVTAMDHARNAVIARTADALVAVDGSMGTLSEIALGLKTGTPVVVIEGDSDIRPALEELDRELLRFADSPAAAVDLALKLSTG